MMAEIVTLRGTPHERTEQLLPWYAKGTLNEADTALVELHLAECAECCEELMSERALAGAIGGLPLESAQGWDAVAKRLGQHPQRASRREPGAWFSQRVSAGRAMGGAMAAASVAAVLAISLTQRAPADQTYTALGSPRGETAGNAVVMFAPDTSERQLRELLTGANARVVDGPTAAGGYVLQLAASNRDAALGTLRRSTKVVMAEPIDSGKSP